MKNTSRYFNDSEIYLTKLIFESFILWESLKPIHRKVSVMKMVFLQPGQSLWQLLFYLWMQPYVHLISLYILKSLRWFFVSYSFSGGLKTTSSSDNKEITTFRLYFQILLSVGACECKTSELLRPIHPIILWLWTRDD